MDLSPLSLHDGPGSEKCLCSVYQVTGVLSQPFEKKIFHLLFNQVGKLRTSSHLQLHPGQDKVMQFDTYNNTELHME